MNGDKKQFGLIFYHFAPSPQICGINTPLRWLLPEMITVFGIARSRKTFVIVEGLEVWAPPFGLRPHKQGLKFEVGG